MHGKDKNNSEKTLIRLGPRVWGRHEGIIPIGKTRFIEEMLNTGRVRRIRLGPRSIAVIKEEVEGVREEIINASET